VFGGCWSFRHICGVAAVALGVTVLGAPMSFADTKSDDPKPGDPCMNTEADSVTADGKFMCAQDGSKFLWLNARMKGSAGAPCDDEGAKVFGFGYPLPIITCTRSGSGLIWK
jgi:hypothetical protein